MLINSSSEYQQSNFQEIIWIARKVIGVIRNLEGVP